MTAEHDDSEADVRDRYRRRTALGTMAIGLFAGCLNLREETEQGTQSNGDATEPTTETDDQPDEPTPDSVSSYDLEERWVADLETGTVAALEQASGDGALYAAGGDPATVVRVSPADGTTRWSRSLEAPLPDEDAIELSSDEEVLAVGIKAGTVRLLDADDGTTLWERETVHSEHIGIALGSENVIVLSDTTDDEGGAVTALNRSTGRIEWRNTREDFLAVDDSPVLLSQVSAPVDGWIFVGGWNGSYRIATADGSIDGEEFRSASRGWTTVGDRFYVPDREGINAVSVPAWQRRWRAESLGRVRNRPALADGSVYFGAEDDGYYAVDAETGDREWRLRFVEARGPPPEPAVSTDRVWVSDRVRSVYGIDRATGELDGVQELESESGSIRSVRTRADSILVLETGALRCFELP
ncbi:PQQ-binding-like beta-propeller repeat protein [Natrinema salsiterrestre]|uniref:PQQ-binding-like beta-propeller repeat protein n=1 Tax=Natrinema salsiterrestre TaxID=2950540 RepID=A0A9Q4L2G8_9EURY|nr:PQQ-binding-like beta-propeller repeat protein [Natrinema salsiterrestre]MDF9746409.1 PQQ-binding-like beta-propeller repeat protein [Natrinema salsiterrestre]